MDGEKEERKLPLVVERGMKYLLGFDDESRTEKCTLCLQYRYPLLEAKEGAESATSEDNLFNQNELQVCYFCLRDKAPWGLSPTDGPEPCANCLAFGYFDDGQFQPCTDHDNSLYPGMREGTLPLVSPEECVELKASFKKALLRQMNAKTLRDRYNLLMALKRPEFEWLPKDLRRYMCETGLPLPCLW